MDGEEDVLVGCSADCVGEEEEFEGEWVGGAEEEGGGELDGEDEEDEGEGPGGVAHKFADLRKSESENLISILPRQSSLSYEA